jgi:murein DD-endopeptidase MepM/ murein hydrolase activator NlpD
MLGHILALQMIVCGAPGASSPQGAESANAGTFAAIARSAAPNGPSRVIVHVAGKWTTRGEVTGARILWAPDGRWLAVSAEVGRSGAIWVLPAAETAEAWRASDSGSDPAWSPDSGRLAFARGTGGVSIALVAARTVADVAGSERGYAPAWAPSGETIAFARAQGGSGSLWSVATTGGMASRLAVCARPLALAWDARGVRLAVLEHDPAMMQSPRLSVLNPNEPAPTPVCGVSGPPLRWAADDRVEVGAGLPNLVSIGKVSATVPAAPARTVPPLPAGLALVTAAWTSVVIPAATGPASTTPSSRDGTKEQSPGSPDTVLPAVPVVSPMVFPVCGSVTWSDTFGEPRDSSRRHVGQDIMAPKMRPIVAAFDGQVTLRPPSSPGGHYWLILTGDNGWIATYLHLNNDTPGTDDGLGAAEHAYAPGLVTGSRVIAGQLLGFVGDSGNAESTAPHLHFELAHAATRIPMNPAASLAAATRLDSPKTP